jgi:hypothetical protein
MPASKKRQAERQHAAVTKVGRPVSTVKRSRNAVPITTMKMPDVLASLAAVPRSSRMHGISSRNEGAELMMPYA